MPSLPSVTTMNVRSYDRPKLGSKKWTSGSRNNRSSSLSTRNTATEEHGTATEEH